jgi:serine/threonine-protein kinase
VLLSQSKSTVTVPNVAGQSEQAAGSALRRSGLNPVPSLASSSTVGIGLVVSQTPPAGSVVERGARVNVVVSGGPASAALMNVTGLSASQARATLSKAGFKPTTKTQSSSTVAAGLVIGSEPPAGTVTQVGSSVAVLVSSGPAPVRVPDVAGQTLNAAEATLTNAGLALGTVTQRVSSTQAPETVLSQSPSTGSSVRSGSKVDLTVAQAPKEIAVPGVVGQSETLAETTLLQAGFKPKPVPATTAEQSQVGQILKQSPAAGAHARKGATVTISVGVLGPKTTPTTTTTTTTTPPTTTTTTTPPPAPTG